jgi:nucleoside-diphosphate-sugar epimerase
MNLVTGATGLLGSHIVEQLRLRDRPVRALVRRDSDRTWLQTQGVEFVEGDITDPASLRRACAGCDVVYHAAAKVGDWGPWEDFQRVTIDGTNHVIEACAEQHVRRLIHISSISVFGYYTKEGTIDETFPTGYKLYKWAYYSRSKWIAENNVLAAHRSGKVRATVIRPAWIYGPRDRATIARLVGILQRGEGRILGKGDNRLNLVYAGRRPTARTWPAKCSIAAMTATSRSSSISICWRRPAEPGPSRSTRPMRRRISSVSSRKSGAA